MLEPETVVFVDVIWHRPRVNAKSKSKSSKLSAHADKYALYRLSVQDPDHEVGMFQRFYKDAYGTRATTLREDFCAGFAVCCEWVKQSNDHTAVGVDLDPEPLAYGKEHYLSALSPAQQKRVTLQQKDVLQTTTKAQIIAAQNYSFFLFKTRDLVTSYFRSVHRSLTTDGLFVMDMMGGSSMMVDGCEESRAIKRPTAADKRDNPPFRYVWEQKSFNPITAEVLFHIHFRFSDGSALEKAFTYDWRLWTIPEVKEMLADAGFSEIHVYWETNDKDGNPSGNYRRSLVGKPDPAWLCYIAAKR
jgi:hypothetical protein